MKILIDGNITAARDIFHPHGEVVRMDGRQIRRRHLHSVDALVIRSVTRIDAELLDGTPVRFVGTTTIGTDHLDIPWLEENCITWASAPGCNADSAAQYTLAMIWLACERLGIGLAGRSAGIIGRGNVGSRVTRLLNLMGVETVANDPPLADRGETGLVSFEEALAQDIVSLHVPLVKDGPYPTLRMLDARALNRLPPQALLVNTARGAVVEGAALKQKLSAGLVHGALDVWPDEPHIDRELVLATSVATPHVAGYSNDGKFNGARQIYRAFCRWAGETECPLPPVPGGPWDLWLEPERSSVSQVLEATCFVGQHDRAMQELARLPPDALAQEFDRLRREYPARRDFHAWTIHGARPKEEILLRQLGFSIGKSAPG
jgi:erythronate-4-phosphate dehydrogenase